MRKNKIHKIIAGLLLCTVLAVSTQNGPELTLQVQAQESVSRAAYQTADLTFLSYFDESKLAPVTVTETQAAEMKKLVNQLTAGLKTDYEKVGVLYQWVNTNVRYPANDENILPAVDAYDVFTQRVAVCGGFSNLFNELLHLIDIPSVAVAGYYHGYGYPAAHQWNAVYADGRWFYADTTGAGYDVNSLFSTHQVIEVYNAVLKTDGLLIGYYNGTAVIGTGRVMKEVTIPDSYEDLKITSVSYQIFDKAYGVEVLNIGANVSKIEKTTLISAENIKAVNVSAENATYASRDGVLYTKDMKELLAYPKAREDETYVLPKETTTFDMKDAFSNMNLKSIEVEAGNAAYSSYDGALYDAEQKQLLFVPAGKETIMIPAEATISDMAFANSDRENMIIYGTPGSYAETFAGWYNITFIDINELEETPADKSRLENLVNGALTDFSEYTEESAKAYQDALAAAREVLTDINATQEEVDEAYDALFAAVAALEEKEEPVDPPVEEEVVRLYGSGRYETGYAVADALKEVLGVEKFEAVVVATGKNFADALAGSYLAVEKNAPILLTSGKDDNVAQLHAYIKENVAEGGKVYLLGGEAAVPAAVEAIEGYDVVRLFGDSRYDTNIAILKEAGVSGDSIIVATGKTFADSLSASAANLPILLVKPNASLNDAQKEILAGMKNIYIVGGEGAVSIAYAEELAVYGEVTRVFGSSRYDTSVEIAKTFCKDVTKAVVASGKNFPDGLCGGPLAAALNAPLVLTKDGGAAAAAGYVAEKGIASGFVLGGDGALTDETIVNVFGLTSSEEIVK